MMRLRAAALSIFLLGLSGCGDIRYEGNDGALTTTDTGSDEVGDECVPLAVDVEPVFEELGLQSADGKQLAATIARPGSATCRPGLVLIHQFGLDRSQWAPHVPAFVEAGYVVLTLDLRGHGQSDPADGALTDLLEDPNQAPLDVDAALAALAQDGAVDPERLAVVGTSIGANLAVVAMHQHPEVDLAVPISPRMPPLLSLAGLSDAAELSLRPLFCFAGELDSSGEQAQTCNDLVALAGDPSQARILTGTAAHGVAIVDDFAETVPDIITWLGDAGL